MRVKSMGYARPKVQKIADLLAQIDRLIMQT